MPAWYYEANKLKASYQHINTSNAGAAEALAIHWAFGIRPKCLGVKVLDS